MGMSLFGQAGFLLGVPEVSWIGLLAGTAVLLWVRHKGRMDPPLGT